MNIKQAEDFKQVVLDNTKKVVGKGNMFPECPEPPPCEYCGRIMYAGVCCDKRGKVDD